MKQLFPDLTARNLLELAEALRSGRIPRPANANALEQVVASAIAAGATHELQQLYDQGFSQNAAATMIECLAAERSLPRIGDLLDLVTTGPEAQGVANRDTAVVVRELFASATQSVLVAGYAVHRGRKVFDALADRMRSCPQLSVRLFLDIQRPRGDTTMSNELVRRFARRMASAEWPNDAPKPTVYYFARSLDVDKERRASLHAKCVVVDRSVAFVSSANFTEAAHEKNIEVGVLIRSRSIASQLSDHFELLVASGELQPVPWDATM